MLETEWNCLGFTSVKEATTDSPFEFIREIISDTPQRDYQKPNWRKSNNCTKWVYGLWVQMKLQNMAAIVLITDSSTQEPLSFVSAGCTADLCGKEAHLVGKWKKKTIFLSSNSPQTLSIELHMDPYWVQRLQLEKKNKNNNASRQPAFPNISLSKRREHVLTILCDEFPCLRDAPFHFSCSVTHLSLSKDPMMFQIGWNMKGV